jgi:hypothetical protein
MKNAVFILAVLLFISCSSKWENETKWEYKTISIKGEELESFGKQRANYFKVSDTELNSLGNDGWELTGMYEKIETVHPNFGDDRYVTGMQPNVRTSEINFVFKRKKTNQGR